MKRKLAVLLAALTALGSIGVGVGAAADQLRDQSGGGQGMIRDQSKDGTGLDTRTDGTGPLLLLDGTGPHGPYAGGF